MHKKKIKILCTLYILMHISLHFSAYPMLEKYAFPSEKQQEFFDQVPDDFLLSMLCTIIQTSTLNNVSKNIIPTAAINKRFREFIHRDYIYDRLKETILQSFYHPLYDLFNPFIQQAKEFSAQQLDSINIALQEGTFDETLEKLIKTIPDTKIATITQSTFLDSKNILGLKNNFSQIYDDNVRPALYDVYVSLLFGPSINIATPCHEPQHTKQCTDRFAGIFLLMTYLEIGNNNPAWVKTLKKAFKETYPTYAELYEYSLQHPTTIDPNKIIPTIFLNILSQYNK